MKKIIIIIIMIKKQEMNKKTLFLFFFPLSFLDMEIINIQRISWPARKPFCVVGDKANGRQLKDFQSAYSRPSRLGLLHWN